MRIASPFQLTAARRRLVKTGEQCRGVDQCFNSQPPEGGWIQAFGGDGMDFRFNSQPPEGGWLPIDVVTAHERLEFQLTAARRRLDIAQQATYQGDSFNSQPPEGGWLRPCVLVTL